MSDRDFQAAQAVAEARSSLSQVLTSPTANQETKDSALSVYSNTFKWLGHHTLTVCIWPNPKAPFSASDIDVIKSMISAASRWNGAANMMINFYDDVASSHIRTCVNHGSAEIRVAIYRMPDSYYSPSDAGQLDFDWGRYGKSNSQNTANVSVSLVRLREYYLNGLDADGNFDSSHEFGHALGLIHEFQRINCIAWLGPDKQVMDAYGWTDPAILTIFKANLQQIPTSDPVLDSQPATSFDINSVMVYNFPQDIWRAPRSGEVNPCTRPNDVQFPDEKDFAGLRRMYGTLVAQTTPPPVVAGAELPPPPGAPAIPPPELAPPAAPAPAAQSDADRLRGSIAREQDIVRTEIEHAVANARSTTGPFTQNCLNLFGNRVCIPTPNAGIAESQVRQLAVPQVNQSLSDAAAAERLIQASERAAALAAQ